ncbi:hypothetical protein N7508_000467 [Penicillium antarcticum]|uniref:uncharacterized protein n=1 Tax=Penicillium antarcticum TaxID=416450 RepID=UPI00238E6570|nr:uncharacterized protein N7508_000467 [Penicillium antarcticum]KAJ5320184.1 hypothetical protein N7508_000467 [Penicillium antarcticum]
MADKKPVSFDDIILADREKNQKKKQEELANQLLGKNRRRSAPASGSGSGSGTNRGQNRTQNAKPGSLASRIGVAKRSTSATVNANKNKPTPVTNTGRSRGNTGKNDRAKSEKVWDAIRAGNSQANVRPAKQSRGSGNSLSIKGASGPFVVVGRNFAPGTTAADIQSALEPTTGPMLSCRIVSSQPSVVAEFAFAEKQTAELVIANFDNQRADGRVLTMSLKSANAKPGAQDPFTALRAQADQERLRARGGAGHQKDLLAPQTSQSGLYSDEMMVDTPQQNNKGNQNQNRRRGRR